MTNDMDNLYFNAYFPFKPSFKELIYLEDGYDDFFNSFFRNNLEEVTSRFKSAGYNFIYFPSYTKILNTSEAVRYRYPALRHFTTDPDLNVSSNILLQYLARPHEIKPSFILFKGTVQNCGPLFGYYELERTEDFLDEFIRRLYADRNYDFTYDPKTLEIMDKMADYADILLKSGVPQAIIDIIVKPREEFSSLVVTPDMRIFLPKYDMEISMFPLPKTVFLLYLKHPEGIMFKCLSDHRKEIVDIYERIIGRDADADAERSIDALIDPTNNSINEKCARIRESFISRFDETLAHNYYITGERGKAKKITLPRSLVRWEF
jgi:hypothetical protein